jgi:phage-related protein
MAEMRVHFFRTQAGNEPARDWLRGLPADQRHAIGEDLMVVQYRWPLGMPLVRKMEPRLWELRSPVPDGIARLFFTVWETQIVVLHGFVKKGQKTPEHELETAQRRLAEFTRNTP